MHRRHLCTFVVVGWMVLTGCVARSDEPEADQAEQPAAPTLTVGSSAPALNIEHWIQDGGGKFKPVTKFEPGKVYVVEFWATWCGPCIVSMPHLAELQKKHEDKVQVISISDEPLETVESFLEKPLREDGEEKKEDKGEGEGEEARTYRDLTSAWSLTTDPDGSAYKDYMEAAQQNGIPTAFIVGKTGEVEWIGHPMIMDSPLEQILADTWDRAKFKEELAAKEAAKRKMQTMMAAIQKALQEDDADKAVAIVDENIADASGTAATQLKQLKFRLLIHVKKFDEATSVFKTLTADEENGAALSELSWQIYQLVASGTELSKELVEQAIVAGEKAVASSEGRQKAYALDTLAHLKHHLGQLDEAIELQQQAVELAAEDRLTMYLEELKKEKDGGQENEKKEPTEEKDDTPAEKGDTASE